MNDPAPAGLLLRDAGVKGLGVYALRRFRRGQRLLLFAGPRLLPGEISDHTHVIQVDAHSFLGPSGGVDDYVNHSCDPNAGLRSVPGGLALFALRTIRPAEEVTFDYSTCILDEPPLERCACGAPSCRGTIVAFPDLPPDVRERYLRAGAVPDHALASLSGARAG